MTKSVGVPIENELVWFTDTPDENWGGCGLILRVTRTTVIVRVRHMETDDTLFPVFKNGNKVSECGKFTRCNWQCQKYECDHATGPAN